MRAFLAIDLPEPVVSALMQVIMALPVGRPVPEDNLHLTLAFLDDQSEEQLEQLHYELHDLRMSPLELGFDGLGSFGSGAPKILFARIADNAALMDLHRQIRRAAHRAGIVLARERYKPHVTLARFGRGVHWRDADQLAEFVADHVSLTLPTFPVNTFSLFESQLHQEGALHHQIAEYEFAGQA